MSNEDEVLDIVQVSFPADKKGNPLFDPKFLAKYVKERAESYSLEKVWIMPGIKQAKERFMSLTLNPTDDFQNSLSGKIRNLYSKELNQSKVFYKIVYEKAEKKAEYLLSIMLVPQFVYKKLTKQLRLNKDVSVQWIAPDYSKIKSLGKVAEDSARNNLVINITNDYTDLVFFQGNKTRFAKRIEFSISLVKQALREDHFSPNQIKNALEVDLDFSEYYTMDRILSFRMVLDSFIHDITRNTQILLSVMDIKITNIIIFSTAFKNNKLDILVKESTHLPTIFYDFSSISQSLIEIPRNNLLGIRPDDLYVVQSIKYISQQMELFLSINIKRLNIGKTRDNKGLLKSIIKNIYVQFFVIFILTIVVFVFFDMTIRQWKIRSNNDLKNTKNKVTRVKKKYLDALLYSTELENLQTVYTDLNTQKSNQNFLKKAIFWVYKLKPEKVTLLKLTYRSDNGSLKISGKADGIEVLNKYFEEIGEKVQFADITMENMSQSDSGASSFDIRLTNR